MSEKIFSYIIERSNDMQIIKLLAVTGPGEGQYYCGKI